MRKGVEEVDSEKRRKTGRKCELEKEGGGQENRKREIRERERERARRALFGLVPMTPM